MDLTQQHESLQQQKGIQEYFNRRVYISAVYSSLETHFVQRWECKSDPNVSSESSVCVCLC